MAKQILQTTVYGIQKTVVEKDTYVKAFVGEVDPDDSTVKGISIMSINCEVDVFDQVAIKDFPCECNIEMKIIRGGQNKMTQRVTGIQPARSANKTAA